jgi:molybdopterin-guanine dinucleotide biosynthesis protein B
MKIFGIAGYSGSGKTTLIEKLIPLFAARGLTVSLIKHAHHTFDVDQPGKDSYRHRHAGCQEVLVTSSRRWALMHELRGAPEPALADLVKHVAACDLLLIEGFKHEPISKLEVYRSVVGESLLHPQDAYVVAVASDQPVDTRLPQFRLDDAAAIAAFIVKHAAL